MNSAVAARADDPFSHIARHMASRAARAGCIRCRFAASKLDALLPRTRNQMQTANLFSASPYNPYRSKVQGHCVIAGDGTHALRVTIRCTSRTPTPSTRARKLKPKPRTTGLMPATFRAHVDGFEQCVAAVVAGTCSWTSAAHGNSQPCTLTEPKP